MPENANIYLLSLHDLLNSENVIYNVYWTVMRDKKKSQNQFYVIRPPASFIPCICCVSPILKHMRDVHQRTRVPREKLLKDVTVVVRCNDRRQSLLKKKDQPRIPKLKNTTDYLSFSSNKELGLNAKPYYNILLFSHRYY